MIKNIVISINIVAIFMSFHVSFARENNVERTVIHYCPHCHYENKMVFEKHYYRNKNARTDQFSVSSWGIKKYETDRVQGVMRDAQTLTFESVQSHLKNGLSKEEFNQIKSAFIGKETKCMLIKDYGGKVIILLPNKKGIIIDSKKNIVTLYSVDSIKLITQTHFLITPIKQFSSFCSRNELEKLIGNFYGKTCVGFYINDKVVQKGVKKCMHYLDTSRDIRYMKVGDYYNQRMIVTNHRSKAVLLFQYKNRKLPKPEVFIRSNKYSVICVSFKQLEQLKNKYQEPEIEIQHGVFSKVIGSIIIVPGLLVDAMLFGTILFGWLLNKYFEFNGVGYNINEYFGSYLSPYKTAKQRYKFQIADYNRTADEYLAFEEHLFPNVAEEK